MSIILALIAGLAGAALGFAAGATLGSLLAQVLSISSFEGGAGYFAVAIGIAGGVVGFFIGAALTLRRYGGYRGFGAITSRLMLVVLVFGILAAIGILMQLASVEHFRGANPLLQFDNPPA